MTKYQFTGQFSNVSDFGLMYYGSRWYDSSLGRFAQADSIVQVGVQGWDRYAYVSNNPVRYTDPSGHMEEDFTSENMTCKDKDSCTADGKLYVRPRRPHSSTEPIPPSTPSYEGFSDSDLDAIFSFWEKIITPVNDFVEIDDIYRMSSHGGWKAARYSLNLGIFEGIVQGARQAYRDKPDAYSKVTATCCCWL